MPEPATNGRTDMIPAKNFGGFGITPNGNSAGFGIASYGSSGSFGIIPDGNSGGFGIAPDGSSHGSGGFGITPDGNSGGFGFGITPDGNSGGFGINPYGNSGGFGTTPDGNSGKISSLAGARASASGSHRGGLLQDMVSGLIEQEKLAKGLVKNADLSRIMGYIKLAASMPNKNARDIALMLRKKSNEDQLLRKEITKQRRLEERNRRTKMKDMKEKITGSSSKLNIPLDPQKMVASCSSYEEKMMDSSSSSRVNIPLAPQQNAATYSFMEDNNQNSHGALSCRTVNLLEENTQIINQIAANLATSKLEDNIDLFCRVRNNMTAILDDTRGMYELMRRMPPFHINEELFSLVKLKPCELGNLVSILKQEQAPATAPAPT